jgi:ribosomal protein L15
MAGLNKKPVGGPVKRPIPSVPSFIVKLLGKGKAQEAAKTIETAKKKKKKALEDIAKDL